jgi:hypothetical protein
MSPVNLSATPAHRPSALQALHPPFAPWLTMLGRWLALLAVIAIMAIIAKRLFTGMTMTGMMGVDTFQYWKFVDDILHDKRDFVFNRLSFYALNMLAFKILGSNDYAIRAFVAGFNVLNIGLLYLLAFRLSRSAAVALIAAALYAFNSVVLTYASTELPHILGGTFALICCLATLIVVDWSQSRGRRLAAVFIIGVALSGAIYTHEDLVFFAAGYGLVIAILFFLRDKSAHDAKVRTIDVALMIAMLVVGGVAGAVWPMPVTGIGPSKIVNDFITLRTAIDQNTLTRTAGEFFRVVPPRAMKNFFVDTLGWPLTALAGTVALAVPVAVFRSKDIRYRHLLAIEIPVLTYVVGFLGIGRIFLEFGYQRLFVPLMGPVIAFIVCGVYLLCRDLPFRRTGLAVLFAALLFPAWPELQKSFVAPYISPHRILYDSTKNLVTSDRKLLMPACYGIYAPWMGIGSQVYLGDNVVATYLMENFKSFDEVVAEQRIGYVLVPLVRIRNLWGHIWPLGQIETLFRVTYTTPLTDDQIKSLAPLSQDVWRGDTRVEWSREICAFEADVVRRLLEQRQAKLVGNAPGVGDIYALKPAP